MTAYGEALARYRNEAGLNQRKLGAAIGLDPTQVNKIERGHRPPLGAKYIKPLVRALRLSRSEAENLVVDLGGLPRKVLDFMDDEAVKPKQQADSTPRPIMANPVVEVGDTLLGTTGQYIDRLIASGGLSPEEEDEMAAALIEMTKRFLAFREAMRQMEQEK